MDFFKLWNPSADKELSGRLATLKDYVIKIYPYEGDIPGNPAGFRRIIDMIRAGINVKSVNYFRNLEECFFDGGGVERTLGLYFYNEKGHLHEDVGSFLTLFGVPSLYDFEDIPETERKNFNRKDFAPLYSEIHLVDQESLNIPGLDTRLSYFFLPGIKYVKQPYIQSLNLDISEKVIDEALENAIQITTEEIRKGKTK